MAFYRIFFPAIAFDLSPTAVALVAMTIVFLSGIITWDDMVQTKAVWNTFIWFGAILGLSTALTKAKFFAWLATFMQTNLALDFSPLVVVLILSAISVVIRYLFASSTAYIASMLPVFLTVGMASGVDPVMFGLVLLATNAFGGLVTHYGASPGPIIYSAGYNNLKDWWTLWCYLSGIELDSTLCSRYPLVDFHRYDWLIIQFYNQHCFNGTDQTFATRLVFAI